MEFLSLSPGTIVTPVISITPPRIIELNEVSGSVETNSSSKRARARVPHPTRQLRRRSKSNLPIGVNYRLTMPGLARCLNVRARTKSDGVISYTNGITRSNSRADKRPTKKAAKVEADPSFPVSFYYLLPCWFDLHPPPYALSFVQFHRIFLGRTSIRGSSRCPRLSSIDTAPSVYWNWFHRIAFNVVHRGLVRLRFCLKTESWTAAWENW